MLKKFKTQELIVIALIAALVFVVDLIFVSLAPEGSPQRIITTIISLVITAILIVMLIKTCPKFGVLTLFSLIYGILELPTPLGVAPGFWPKIIINVLCGFLGDWFIYAFKYRNWSILVGAWIFGLFNQILFILAMILLGFPVSNYLSVLILPIILAFLIFSGLGFWLGLKIYSKLKNKAFTQQISS
jgi:hypothetical protein